MARGELRKPVNRKFKAYREGRRSIFGRTRDQPGDDAWPESRALSQWALQKCSRICH